MTNFAVYAVSELHAQNHAWLFLLVGERLTARNENAKVDVTTIN